MYVLVVGTAVRHLRPGLCLQALTSPIPQSVFTQDGASYLACFSFLSFVTAPWRTSLLLLLVYLHQSFNETAENMICRPVSIIEGKTRACQPEDKPQHLHGKQNPGLTSRKEQTNQGQRSTQAAQKLFSYICKHAHLHRLGKSLPNHII